MIKTFTYSKETQRYYRNVNINGEIEREYDGSDFYDFEYTPDPKDLKEALIEIVTDYYFADAIKNNPTSRNHFENQVKYLIDDADCEEALFNTFEEELKEYFESEALESEGDR